MRQINFETNDEDLARILEAVESSAENTMKAEGKSHNMDRRANAHTHCDHLMRIATEIRTKLDE